MLRAIECYFQILMAIPIPQTIYISWKMKIFLLFKDLVSIQIYLTFTFINLYFMYQQNRFQSNIRGSEVNIENSRGLASRSYPIKLNYVSPDDPKPYVSTIQYNTVADNPVSSIPEPPQLVYYKPEQKKQSFKERPLEEWQLEDHRYEIKETKIYECCPCFPCCNVCCICCPVSLQTCCTPEGGCSCCRKLFDLGGACRCCVKSCLPGKPFGFLRYCCLPQGTCGCISATCEPNGPCQSCATCSKTGGCCECCQNLCMPGCQGCSCCTENIRNCCKWCCCPWWCVLLIFLILIGAILCGIILTNPSLIRSTQPVSSNIQSSTSSSPQTQDHMCEQGYFYHNSQCLKCPEGSSWNGQNCVVRN